MTLHRLFLNTTFLTSVPYESGDIHADPVTASIIAYTGATGLTAVAIGIGVNLAMAMATTALMGMLADKPKESGGIPTDSPTTGEETPLKFILGTYSTSGQFVDAGRTFSTTSKRKNQWLTYINAISDLPIEGVERVMIDSNTHNFREDGVTLDGRNFFGPTVDGDKFRDAYFRVHDGRQTKADDLLLSIYANHPRPWTEKHLLQGTAYVVSTFGIHDQKYNGLPTVRFEVKGARLYDPRKDSTNGGNGPQRFNDPATHTFTENPVVMIYNLVRGIRIPPSHVYGLNASADSFRMARWFAAMNACDQIVDGEPRYRAGMEVATDQQPLTVIQALLDSCGGQLVEYGGVYDIGVGAAGLPVAAITDDDIIIDQPSSEMTFKGIHDSYNTIRASYPNPSNGWETEEAVPYSQAEWIAEDDGLELVADLKLSAVPFPKQVRRLMREAGTDHRRRRIHSIVLPPSHLNLRPLDTISWTSPSRYYSGKLFEVQAISVDPMTLCVQADLRERDPKDYDLDAIADAIQPIQPTKPDNVVPIIEGVDGFTVTAHTIEDASGKGRRPAIKVVWDADNSYPQIAWQLRLAGKTAISLNGTAPDPLSGEMIIADGILPDTAYEMNFRILNPAMDTRWSAWTAVKTLPIKLGFIDFDPEVRIDLDAQAENVRLADLARQQAEQARNAANTIFQNTDALKVSAEAAKDASIAGQRASELARDQSKADRLLAEAAANRASISEGIAVQASKDGQTTVMLSLPATFADGGNSWTQDLVGNPVTTTPIVSDARFGFSSNAQEGPYIYILGSGIDSIYVLTRGVIPVTPGQTFRINARTTSNGNVNRRKMLPVFVLLDGSYDLIEERRYAGRGYSSQMAFADQVAEFTIPADSPARFLRYGMVADNSLSASNGYISLCRGTDVSSELAAGLAAAASANSATMASASANSAGQFASAARAESLAANTHASDARSWSIQSANSASSANTASSQAQAAQGLAVQARDVAQGHANTANTHARASLSSAQDASAFANSAGQFATAARADMLAANTHKADALIYRNESLAARNTANGHAVAANTNAGISVSARDAAQLAANGAATSANTAAGHSNTAQRHATAAANSASGASASMTKASEYADASLSSSLSANTSRAQSLTFRNESANSATIAQGHANAAAGSAATANTNAGLSVSAKNDSQNAASASLKSSTDAAAAANLATQQSTISTQQALIATTASADALKTVAETLPAGFEKGVTYWTNDANGNPATVSDLSGNRVGLDQTEIGPALYLSSGGNAQNIYVMQKGAIPYIQGRTYRITTLIRTNGSQPNITSNFIQIIVNGMNQNYGNAGTGFFNTGIGFTGGTTWASATHEWTATSATSAFVRFGLFIRHADNPGLFVRVSYVKVEDITSEVAARTEAAASARDSASASASKTGAEQAATASRQAETNARTEAGKASSSATAAARSETNAKGSENAAATQAQIAVSASGASLQNAVKSLPSTFETLDWWSGEQNRAPEVVNGPNTARWSIADDTDNNQGKILRGVSADRTHILTKGVLPYVKGRTIRVTMIARLRGGGTVENTFCKFFLSNMNGNFGNVNNSVQSVGIATGPSWNTYSHEFLLNNDIAAWCRIGLEMNGQDGPSKSLEVARFIVEDVTATKESEQWAGASSSSASAAQGFANTASSQATAATQARNTADSHRAAAQTSENRAAQASTDAAGSAAQALTHMENASRLTGGGVSTNPVFSQWTGSDASGPNGYRMSAGSGQVRRATGTMAKYTNGIRVTSPSNSNDIRPTVELRSADHGGPSNPSMVRVRFEFSRVNGAIYKSSILARWNGSNRGDVRTMLASELGTPHPEQNVPQSVEFIVERPANFNAGSSPSFTLFFDTQDASEGSSADLVIHRFDFEEVNQNSVAAMTMATKATVDGQSSLIALRTKAGGASAGLEVVSMATPNGQASQIRMDADEFIMNGTIRNAKIVNAAIDTLKIGNNAVTVPVGATGPVTSQTGSGTYAQLCRITVNLPEAGPILIFWSIRHNYYAGGFGRYGIRIEFNGQIIEDKHEANQPLDFPSGQSYGQGNKGNNVIRLLWRGWDAQRIEAIGSLSAIGAMR